MKGKTAGRDDGQVAVGVIGGSGLYEMDGLEDVRWVKVKTPFGEPSDAYCVGRLGQKTVIFLARHGRGHRVTPSDINYRANIYGLKSLGATAIISVSAVGSMKEDIHPLDIVIPDQFFDHTKRRVSSFFGEGIVAHVGMADPVCRDLAGALETGARESGARVHRGGTYICIEGPQFSTRGESNVYRRWGMSVIGMTNMPEAKLAREAELCYATMALATDYDVWHEEHDAVSVEAVVANLNEERRDGPRGAGPGAAAPGRAVRGRVPERARLRGHHQSRGLPGRDPQAPRHPPRPVLPAREEGDARVADPAGRPGAIDVLGIGNALVDVLSHASDALVVGRGLVKGTMRLVDEADARDLYDAMGPGVQISGGSAANTIVGVASFGARAHYVGKVRNDQLGEVFAHDLRSTGVGYDTPPATAGPATGRCLILITPDAQRTMSTFLGASTGLTSGDIDARADRAGEDRLSGGLSLRSARGPGGLPHGRADGARGGRQGLADAVGSVLRGPASRGLPRPGRAPRGHPVRQRGRDLLPVSGRRLRRRLAGGAPPSPGGRAHARGRGAR